MMLPATIFQALTRFIRQDDANVMLSHFQTDSESQSITACNGQVAATFRSPTIARNGFINPWLVANRTLNFDYIYLDPGFREFPEWKDLYPPLPDLFGREEFIEVKIDPNLLNIACELMIAVRNRAGGRCPVTMRIYGSDMPIEFEFLYGEYDSRAYVAPIKSKSWRWTIAGLKQPISLGNSNLEDSLDAFLHKARESCSIQFIRHPEGWEWTFSLTGDEQDTIHSEYCDLLISAKLGAVRFLLEEQAFSTDGNPPARYEGEGE